MKKRRIAVLAALAMSPWAGGNAQTPATTTFRVTANVQAVCAITASDLAFGNYTSGSPLLGQTLLQATCTPGTTYNIGLNEGTSGGTINQRKMVSGANNLNYQLYSDASRSVIWGNSTGEMVPGNGTGLAVSHTVYGSVPAGQSVPAGSYGDTITVRVYY